MARDFYINGEALVKVRGMAGSAIASAQELGLAVDQIYVSPEFHFKDVKLDAWGEVPPDTQFMGATAEIRMNLVHFDRAILNTCIAQSMAGAATGSEGVLPRAGTLMGDGKNVLAAGCRYMILGITAPVAGALRAWQFGACYLTKKPFEFPLGNERSVVSLTWRAVPYVVDPWNGGAGLSNLALWEQVTLT